MNPTRVLTSLLALAYWPTAVFAASAADVLKRAEVADKYVSYRGMKSATVYLGGYSASATIKVVHLRPDKTRTIYFSPPMLAGVVLIQDGPDLWKFHPHDETWEQVRCRTAAPSDAIGERALENYEVEIVGTDQVAGRQVYVLQVIPKRRGGTARKLWVDREHYLIIGTQVEGTNGAVLNSSRYTEVEFNPADISPSIFKVSGKLKTAAKPCEPRGFRVAKPTYVPKGYKLVGVSSLTVNGCSSSHLQYSNGVSTLSLFQCKAHKDASPESVKSRLTNVLTWAQGGMQFTLMGDLPRQELQKVANSVK